MECAIVVAPLVHVGAVSVGVDCCSARRWLAGLVQPVSQMHVPGSADEVPWGQPPGSYWQLDAQVPWPLHVAAATQCVLQSEP